STALYWHIGETHSGLRRVMSRSDRGVKRMLIRGRLREEGGAMTRSWTMEDTARALRRPTAADDKYSRGVLGVRTGSDAYPGAAVLGVEAAGRTGLGMVRYVGPARPTALVLARRPET